MIPRVQASLRLGALGALLFTLAGPAAARQGPPPAPVGVDPAQTQQLQEQRRVSGQVRAARRQARLDQWRDEVESGLERARQRVRQLSWSARSTFLDELDELRASVRRLFEDDVR